MQRNLLNILLAVAVIATVGACKKLTTVSAPLTSLNAANVYDNDATAAAVLTGIYTNMSVDNQLSSSGLTRMYFYPALSADELTLFNLNDANLFPYYSNSLTSYSPTFWTDIYKYVFVANSAIEGLDGSSGLTPAVKQQLMAEAEFVRAFCNFYLVNVYGDVPLVTTTNYKTTSVLARTSAAQVYQQIIADLQSAVSLLNGSFLQSDAMTPYPASQAQRVRPTQMAAQALLARTLLYTRDYAGADSMATAVINSPNLSLNSLDSVFLMNSRETIWSLQPVGRGAHTNTGEGYYFILPPTGPNASPNEVYLSDFLLSSFEPGDQRRTAWVDSAEVGGVTYEYPYKYKIGAVITATQEYIMVLRLGEQYLIRAEARAQEGNLAGSAADLNVIRARAGLPTTTATTQPALLAAILHERQVELFTEWGHRWFDLKRTGNINSVMSVVTSQKGGTWSPTDSLYPIPESERTLDPNLVQNAGY